VEKRGNYRKKNKWHRGRGGASSAGHDNGVGGKKEGTNLVNRQKGKPKKCSLSIVPKGEKDDRGEVL